MRYLARREAASPSEADHTWKRYFAALQRGGFRLRDPLYPLFAGEVFHDGERVIDTRDIARPVLTISFRKVHAVDAITRRFGEGPERCVPGMRLGDFRTRVVFREAGLLGLSS